MGLYSLIASSYDQSSNIYTNVVNIKLNGENRLHQIDMYTSSKSKGQILEELRKQNIIFNQDTLSIRYLKNNESLPVYYSVIYNNPKLSSCINNLVEKKILADKVKVSLAIPYSNEYFQEEWLKLKKLIFSGKKDEIKSLYKNSNQLLFLINRYLTSSYDNELFKEQALEDIKLEFSCYKTFRSWIVANTIKKSKVNHPIPKIKPNKIEKPISIEDAIKEYENHIKKLKGISYEQYQTNLYNQQYLDKDQEEFLEEKEMEQVYGKKL